MKALLLLASPFLFLSCKEAPQENPQSSSDQENGPSRTVSERKLQNKNLIIIETSMGDIEAKLHPDTAPITVENFLGYIEKKHYDGTIFHRVISNFMIQGGGFTLNDDVPTEKPSGDEIKNESPSTKSNTRGTLAMARRPQPDSASAQFFINVADNTNLDYPNSGGHGYAVFGEVTKGMDIVDQIKEVQTSSSYMNSLLPNGRFQAAPSQNVPVEPVVIKSIRLASER